MRCYCCDTPVDAASAFDPPTGRFYCNECFLPTVEEQLRLSEYQFTDAEAILLANPEPSDDLENFFSKASEEEEQIEAEKIFYGESEYSRDF